MSLDDLMTCNSSFILHFGRFQPSRSRSTCYNQKVGHYKASSRSQRYTIIRKCWYAFRKCLHDFQNVCMKLFQFLKYLHETMSSKNVCMRSENIPLIPKKRWFAFNFLFWNALLELGCFAGSIVGPTILLFFRCFLWKSGLLKCSNGSCSRTNARQLFTYPRRRIPAFIPYGIKASLCVWCRDGLQKFINTSFCFY